MKKLLQIVCCLLLGNIVMAQSPTMDQFQPVKSKAIDYQCFLPGVDYTFQYDNTFRTVFFDTVVDSATYHTFIGFKVLAYQSDSCLQSEGKNWIGGNMIVFNSGTHCFFNQNNDSIFIYPGSNPGQSWKCFTFEDGNYIEAHINSKEQENFLGITDSVKTIGFQAKDENGLNISHSINNKEIKISKQHGLIQALNFRAFPDLEIPFWNINCRVYQLVGMDPPETGVNTMNFRDVYDFDIGDEFHIKHNNSFFNQYHYSYQAKRVIDKHTYGDSIVYSYSRCGLYYALQTQPKYMEDTISETIMLNDSLSHEFELPLDQYIIFDSTSNIIKYKWPEMYLDSSLNRMVKTYNQTYLSFPPDECIFQISMEDTALYSYIEGLGGPYYDISITPAWDQYILLYYKKGSEEWGNPLDCDSLKNLYPSGLPDYLNHNIVVAPNPMTDFTQITLPAFSGSVYTLRVFHLDGRNILIKQTSGKDFVLLRSDLKAGCYILRISDEEKVVYTGKLIVQ